MYCEVLFVQLYRAIFIRITTHSEGIELNKINIIKLGSATGALLLCGAQINMLQAAEFSQQSPIVYDGTNRTYETPPLGGWEGVLEREEAELQRSLAAQGNVTDEPQKDNAWNVPQSKQREAYSAPQNTQGYGAQGYGAQGNTYNVPQKDITWDVPERFDSQGDFYNVQKPEWDYPTPGGRYDPQKQDNAWSVPQPAQGGFFSAPQNAPAAATQSNTYDTAQQNKAWDAPQSAPSGYYAAPQNAPTTAAPGNTYNVPQQNKAWGTQQPYSNQPDVYSSSQNAQQAVTQNPAAQGGAYTMPQQTMPQQNYTRQVPQAQGQQSQSQQAQSQQARAQQSQARPSVNKSQQINPAVNIAEPRPYDIPQQQAWDNTQVTQGIWDQRMMGVPGYGRGPGYGGPGYGGRRNSVPGFGGSGFNAPWNNGSWGGPWNNGNSSRGFMPWGGRN